jgi:serine/threonine protein phosphatase PrpC
MISCYSHYFKMLFVVVVVVVVVVVCSLFQCEGHGGSGAAIYAGQEMVKILEETAQYKQYVAAKDPGQIELLGAALRQAFLDADELLRAYQDTGASDRSG